MWVFYLHAKTWCSQSGRVGQGRQARDNVETLELSERHQACQICFFHPPLHLIKLKCWGFFIDFGVNQTSPASVSFHCLAATWLQCRKRGMLLKSKDERGFLQPCMYRHPQPLKIEILIFLLWLIPVGVSALPCKHSVTESQQPVGSSSFSVCVYSRVRLFRTRAACDSQWRYSRPLAALWLKFWKACCHGY